MTAADALPVGTVVGDFEILGVLGQGGFGIVYEAHEPSLDRRVALKEFYLQGYSRRVGVNVLPANDAAAEVFEAGIARFVREARLLSMLNERMQANGSLVAVYRGFQAHQTAYMAMKRYDGPTLRQTVLAEPSVATEAWLVALLRRMLDALNALHALPGEDLVHRDVSPDNIIIQGDGTPVLLDFGATRKASDAQTSLIYKPGYSPIEQYTDAFKQGPWTDLYALCCVAYFAVAGRSPMPAIDRYAGTVFTPATECGKGRFSAAFLTLVDRGMAVLPEQRFQSAQQMRSALETLPGGFSPLGQPAADEEATRVVVRATLPATLPTSGPGAVHMTVTRERAYAGSATALAASAAAAPRRRAQPIVLGVAASVLALVLALGFLRWQVGVAPSPAPSLVVPPIPPHAAVPSPTSTAAATAPGLPCGAAQADWACVLDGLKRLSSASGGVALKVVPASVALGQPIRLEVQSPGGGTLQVFAVDDAPDAKLSLIFPNTHDTHTTLRPGQSVTLPRSASWTMLAQPPKGRSWMVAVVTNQASTAAEFAGQSVGQGVSLAAAVAAFAQGSPQRLLGWADCKSGQGSCPGALAIDVAAFTIR